MRLVVTRQAWSIDPMIKAQLLVAVLLIQQSGCDQSSKAPAAASPVTPKPPTHRFENVSPTGSLGVALDTTTGQWCRTWDWAYKGTAQRDDLNTLPTCLSLYENTPSSN
jgi:hypothetical protein